MRGLSGGHGTRRWSVGAGALLAGVTLLLGVAGPAGASSSSGAYAQLKKDLLVHSDLPSGWSGQGAVTTSDGGGGGFPGQTQLASCLGVSSSLIDAKSPTVMSPSFQDKAGTHTVQDSVNEFHSTKLASEEYAAVADGKVPGCLSADLQTPSAKQQLQTAMKGVSVGAVSVAAANRSGLVPHSTGFTISFPAASQGISFNVAITIVSMVRGKTGTQLSFTGVGTPFSTSLEHHLASVAYGRS